MTNPTGAQYPISSGRYSATITEVGATLRTLSYDGRDVVAGFGVDEPSSKGHGQQLLPWPNRIRDGRYTFDGVVEQLALTEPERHNAIHGLVRTVAWDLVRHEENSVTLATTVYPQSGWSGILDVTITHRLDDQGLTVEVHATNAGTTPVPFGYAAHPYLTVGESTVDTVAIQVPADSYLEVDDRLLPVALHEVTGTPNDLRSGAELGATVLDTAFTDLKRDDDGRWRVRLNHADRRAELWGDQTYSWIQVFTGDDRRDVSLAIEPMTCGPDAFNEGITSADVIVLAPGESYTGNWGISGR